MQEFVADAAIHANAFGHGLDICPYTFAERGNFVDEGDLCGQKGVGRVFDHLGAFQPGVDNREITQEQRAVHFGHHLFRAVGFHADDNTVRAHEIIDRGPFAQKFRVGGDVKFGLWIGLRNHRLNLAVGAHRNGGFGDDHGVAGHAHGHFGGGGHDISQVSMPIAAPGWCAHGNENCTCTINRGRQIICKGQPASRHILCHQRIKARLVNRHFALVQHFQFGQIFIDANNIMSKVGKAHT